MSSGKSVLVTGSEGLPKTEIEPYTEGKSTFYTGKETFKVDSDVPQRKSPPYPIQESLEQSRASIISQDVSEGLQVRSDSYLLPRP